MDLPECKDNSCWYEQLGYTSCLSRSSSEGASCIRNFGRKKGSVTDHNSANASNAVSDTEACPICGAATTASGQVMLGVEVRECRACGISWSPPVIMNSGDTVEIHHGREGGSWMLIPISDNGETGSSASAAGPPAITSAADLVDALRNGFMPASVSGLLPQDTAAQPGYAWNIMHDTDDQETPPSCLR